MRNFLAPSEKYETFDLTLLYAMEEGADAMGRYGAQRSGHAYQQIQMLEDTDKISDLGPGFYIRAFTRSNGSLHVYAVEVASDKTVTIHENLSPSSTRQYATHEDKPFRETLMTLLQQGRVIVRKNIDGSANCPGIALLLWEHSVINKNQVGTFHLPGTRFEDVSSSRSLSVREPVETGVQNHYSYDLQKAIRAYANSKSLGKHYKPLARDIQQDLEQGKTVFWEAYRMRAQKQAEDSQGSKLKFLHYQYNLQGEFNQLIERGLAEDISEEKAELRKLKR